MTRLLYDIPLDGCAPEPLMAYLKALGVLRLVGEQNDSGARGWWKEDVFWLRSQLDREGLLRFFTDEYRPLPIFSPWNGAGGFLSDGGTSVEVVEWIKNAANPRLGDVQKAVATVESIGVMPEFKEGRERVKALEKKKTNRTITDGERRELTEAKARVKEIKRGVVTTIRGEFPEECLAWLDACMAANVNGFTPSPLLGSGGVDGKLDFGTNFLINVRRVFDGEAKVSAAWVKQALLGGSVALAESAIGQFSPGQIGGPNATQGFEGGSLINPWDFILMLEGSLLLAGAVACRFGVTASGRAAFPFTVNSVAAGFDSASSMDEAAARGETWLPLWRRPVSSPELRHLFGEGRATVANRPARTATDFARAVASLGVDRGIDGFVRVGFLKRSGRAFLATPVGRFMVRQTAHVDLLGPLDPWLDSFRRACGAKGAPARFGGILRRIDDAIIDYCRYGGGRRFQEILVSLGRAERELGTAERFRGKGVKPVPILDSAWATAANDGSQEFAAALSLAGIRDPEEKLGPLRSNLESVAWTKKFVAWAKEDRAVVWTKAPLATNLAAVLDRRLMDGARCGCLRLPIASSIFAPLQIISAYLAGRLDERRVEGLLWGLVPVNVARTDRSSLKMPPSKEAEPLPREYALLKLGFLPSPLIAAVQNGKPIWRMAGPMERGVIVRPESRILPLLRGGRIGEACRIAAQRLRTSGLTPLPGPLLDGTSRDADWEGFGSDAGRGTRLAASLLFPLSSGSVDRLIRMVCREWTDADLEKTVSLFGADS